MTRTSGGLDEAREGEGTQGRKQDSCPEAAALKNDSDLQKGTQGGSGAGHRREACFQGRRTWGREDVLTLPIFVYVLHRPPVIWSF